MKIFIGGAWPYANNSLHVGHLAALLPGDIIARYYRQKGDEVIFVSGTDSHGTPITLRAKKEGVDPETIASKYHQEFVDTFNKLNFSYDLYTKTMDPYHKAQVQDYFQTILNNNYFYEKEEEQEYCPKCEKFLSDREIEGICPNCGHISRGDQCDNCLTSFDPKDLKDKHCKICGTAVILKNNKHLYFALTKFQKELENYTESHSNWRINAINESKKYLVNGLVDRAVTRSLDWGIDTNIKGFEDKKIYVWFEAVLGYLTAGKRFAEEHNIDFDKFMTAKDLRSYYVHGKDNIPFHTIIFPALILALKNNYQLPEYIISSEYINMGDQKMSKSSGGMVTVMDLVNNYDTDTIRYYMTANAPERKDVNFSITELENAHNKFLVGGYGNFINRNLAYLFKNFDGKIPSGKVDINVQEEIMNTYSSVGNHIENGDLRQAIEKITDLISFANKYYDESKPWILVKEDINKFNDVTFTCVTLMGNIANLFKPFLPDSSQRVFDLLEIEEKGWNYVTIKENLILEKAPILFNRIEVK